MSAQTVSTVTKNLDRLVKRFHEAPLKDEWAYLFLDGVSLRVRRWWWNWRTRREKGWPIWR